MITSTHRFHGYNSLRHVYSRGQTVRGPLVSLKYIVNQRRSSYRAAVVVSRKVHKSAIVRNRIRRRIYEVLRSADPAIGQPYDIVVTVFGEQLATIPASELRQLIIGQLERAGIVPAAGVQAGHAIVNTKE